MLNERQKQDIEKQKQYRRIYEGLDSKVLSESFREEWVGKKARLASGSISTSTEPPKKLLGVFARKPREIENGKELQVFIRDVMQTEDGIHAVWVHPMLAPEKFHTSIDNLEVIE